jgi:putative tryptophan/tyrosine transport system substrate-binding protein
MIGSTMRRREVISLLGGAAAVSSSLRPLAARAQQLAMPVVGYLYAGSPEPTTNYVAAFRKGLSEAGFVEGRNVAIEFSFAQNEYDRLPELAADLVRRRVAVIAALGNAPAVRAAKAATATIPIVFAIGTDPVQLGLVASLNRPGGNATGVSFMAVELGSKQLGLLHELVPGAARFAVLVNPTSFATTSDMEREIAVLRAAAAAIGRQIEVLTASTNHDIDVAFANLVQKRADALFVRPDSFFANRRVQFATLAAHHRVPAIYFQREFAETGGMMSYGANAADQFRQAAIYVGRILKGEKPADLPVMQPTRFEFIINLQTVKTLGLTIPPTLLAIADEVIE